MAVANKFTRKHSHHLLSHNDFSNIFALILNSHCIPPVNFIGNDVSALRTQSDTGCCFEFNEDRRRIDRGIVDTLCWIGQT